MKPSPQKIELFNRTIIKELLQLLILGLILLFSGLSYYYSSASQNLIAEMKSVELNQLANSKQSLLKDLNTAIKDLIILSELTAFKEINTPKRAHALKHLQQHFVALSKHRGLYDQVRYLDPQGMEVVRVNFNHGDAAIVPPSKLQNKGKRYYFNDSYTLKQHQIFISPLDLNMEKGQIEQPYKPMIRLGMPVFDAAGNKAGIVLLNYFAQQLIDTVERLSTTQQSDAMLLNTDGYWLYHPEAKRRWGFMFNRNEVMSTLFPTEWAQIRHLKSGQINNENGIFTYDTVYPLGKEMFSSSGAIEAYANSTQTFSSNAYFWKIVTHISIEQINQRENSLLLFTSVHGIVLFLVILTAAWWRAYTRYGNRLAAHALEEEHQRHAATLESSIDAIITTDESGHIVEFNPSAEALFEFRQHDVLGQDVAELIIPEEYRKRHREALERSNFNKHYTGNRGRFEAIAQTMEGRRFPVEITVVRMQQNEKHLYTAFLRDISERKAHEESVKSAKHMLEMRVTQRTEELLKINQDLQEQVIERVRTEERLKIAQEELEHSNQKLAEHAAIDSLTGIANRRTFDSRLQEEWKRCARSHDPVALIMFDIDFFKHYNDNYGHLAGDECLRAIGELLRQGHYAQRTSDLIARYGGEEFAMILSGAHLTDAVRIGETIRNAIEMLNIVHEHRGDELPPVVTVSIGVAALQPISHNSAENLIAAADKALYSAKSRGRNQLVTSDTLTPLK